MAYIAQSIAAFVPANGTIHATANVSGKFVVGNVEQFGHHGTAKLVTASAPNEMAQSDAGPMHKTAVAGQTLCCKNGSPDGHQPFMASFTTNLTKPKGIQWIHQLCMRALL